MFAKYGGKMAHGPRKKQLGGGGNPDLDLDTGNFLKKYW